MRKLNSQLNVDIYKVGEHTRNNIITCMDYDFTITSELKPLVKVVQNNKGFTYNSYIELSTGRIELNATTGTIDVYLHAHMTDDIEYIIDSVECYNMDNQELKQVLINKFLKTL